MSAQLNDAHQLALENQPAVIPRATYRLQLNDEFTFAMATARVPYLASLKISHLYLSPIFRARPGSKHGYDVVNHAELNPELGTESDFVELAETVHQHGMGLVIDIVPNHMAVLTDDNEWWADVLENGPAANYATYFDIDWRPARASMRNRLLLPVLGERYGDELRKGRIQVAFDAPNGRFYVRYGDHQFPLDPKEYPRIFRHQATALDIHFANESDYAVDHQEFESLLDDFDRLPVCAEIAGDLRARRYRDKEVQKRRLARLVARSPMIARQVEAALKVLNGTEGNIQSFEGLADLLAAQPYRLAFWKVAGDEINYRRFFDVNQLAALRVEAPEVFEATHQLVLKLLASRHIDGLRIDHVDGLHDPKAYLAMLRQATIATVGFRPFTVVEKILASHERLRDDWQVDGTTGYEFGAAIVQWLVAEDGMVALDQIYRHHIQWTDSYDDLVYSCKKLIMRTSLAAEIAVLAGQLDRIAQAHPDTMDFTHFALRDALTEVIACFPVYRTYIADGEVTVEDRQSIAWAVGAARKTSRASDRSIFSFIEDVLLGKSSLATTDARRDDMLQFTMKFQQVTSPVMAKSVEDTSFYRFGRLIALNEVGGDPRTTGMSTATLHKQNTDRAAKWPHSLVATSTHDSKRGEDVRYRLAVLSELPIEWRKHVNKWSRFNRSKRKLQGETSGTSRDDEYFLLQSILGVWPLTDASNELQPLAARLKEYTIKVIRESKQITSWIDPDPDYETAAMEFVDSLLSGSRGEHFRVEFGAFAEKLAFFGMLNGLSSLVLKCTVPGIPDFYQGSELPELSLVDPDNRRAVDFNHRTALLQQITSQQTPLVDIALELLRHWRDGRLKLWMTQVLLTARQAQPSLFSAGEYEALTVSGKHSQHVLAFARHYEDSSIVVITSRWTATMMKAAPHSVDDSGDSAPLGECWADTRVELSARLSKPNYTDIFTERRVEVVKNADVEFVELSGVFTYLPVAVLQ